MKGLANGVGKVKNGGLVSNGVKNGGLVSNGVESVKSGVVGGLVLSPGSHRSRLCSLQEGGVVGRARFRNQNRSRSHSASSTDSLGSAHSSCK